MKPACITIYVPYLLYKKVMLVAFRSKYLDDMLYHQRLLITWLSCLVEQFHFFQMLDLEHTGLKQNKSHNEERGIAKRH